MSSNEITRTERKVAKFTTDVLVPVLFVGFIYLLIRVSKE